MPLMHIRVAAWLFIVGIGSLLLPHLPNFTAINAIALIGSSYLSTRYALSTLFSILLVNDLVMGFHATMPFVYLSVAVIFMLGKNINFSLSANLPKATLASSLLFYFFTNFGVWITSIMYTKTLEGLLCCYVAGLPFLLSQIAGDLTYGLAFIIIERFCKQRTQADLLRSL